MSPAHPHLIWFSRYPEPGRSKTRLIPALGPQGAADLQRRMTETIAQTLRSHHQSHPSLTLDLWYSGGSRAQMTTWLPGPWQLYDQESPDPANPDPARPDPARPDPASPDPASPDLSSPDRTNPGASPDLGARMARAFTQAFAQGADRAIIIGSDCPSLTIEHLNGAWNALDTTDIILGPALDGGYYLLGMRQFQPLFVADWGSDRVLTQTWNQALALGLSLQLLSPLRDIDRPEDLAFL
jgi:uncharacterized protein